ncbi:MAG: hypothetical protein WA446_07610 [Steroidobacteraceae bacterium]
MSEKSLPTPAPWRIAHSLRDPPHVAFRIERGAAARMLSMHIGIINEEHDRLCGRTGERARPR